MWQARDPTDGSELPWAGTPELWGWSSSILPDAPGACLSCGAEMKARTLLQFQSITHSTPHPHFLPYLRSPGRQEKSGPGPLTLPADSVTLPEELSLGQQPSHPHPVPPLPGAEKAKHRQTPVGLFPEGNKSPARSDLPTKTVSVTRLRYSPGGNQCPLHSGGFSPLRTDAGSGVQVSPMSVRKGRV